MVPEEEGKGRGLTRTRHMPNRGPAPVGRPLRRPTVPGGARRWRFPRRAVIVPRRRRSASRRCAVVLCAVVPCAVVPCRGRGRVRWCVRCRLCAPRARARFSRRLVRRIRAAPRDRRPVRSALYRLRAARVLLAAPGPTRGRRTAVATCDDVSGHRLGVGVFSRHRCQGALSGRGAQPGGPSPSRSPGSVRTPPGPVPPPAGNVTAVSPGPPCAARRGRDGRPTHGNR